jgi:predicted DNA-binding transcriptional regulator YafY
MSMTVRNLDALVPWVRSFGPDVEVVSPNVLSKRVGQWSTCDT